MGLSAEILYLIHSEARESHVLWALLRILSEFVQCLMNLDNSTAEES